MDLSRPPWIVRLGLRVARLVLVAGLALAAPGGALAAPMQATDAAPAAQPTAPCYAAAVAALTRQGAMYSQGGALAADPIQPDGTPYPRTGPDSFDCSGLVWWAYAHAGITIGLSTYQQLNNGAPIACTLADLHGAATTCWALGDLVFLRYSTGQHVAIYVGAGLFMDCYTHAVGCILHDVASDPFYAAHFFQARRIVSGCEHLTADPGPPQPASGAQPQLEFIPDILAPVSLVLPWQCGSCAPDEQTQLEPITDPPIEWYDLGSWINWLGVQLWNRVARPIICWLLAITQSVLNLAMVMINSVIISGFNWFLRLMVFLLLFLREALGAALAQLGELRILLWRLASTSAQLGGQLAGLRDLAAQLLALAARLVSQIAALVLGAAQALGYLVALGWSLASALLGALLNPTAPPQLAAIADFFLFTWMRDIVQALVDSRLGWAWAAFVALCYLRFAVWLLDELSTLNR